MKITKAGIDTGMTITAAVTSAVVPILVRGHDLSTTVGAAIGAGVAAIVVGYHGGSSVQAATSQTSPVASAGGTSAPVPAIDAAGDPSLPVQ